MTLVELHFESENLFSCFLEGSRLHLNLIVSSIALLMILISKFLNEVQFPLQAS